MIISKKNEFHATMSDKYPSYRTKNTNFIVYSIQNMVSKWALCLASITFFSAFVFSANYTTIADGSYNDCSIWDNGCPPNNIPAGDTVFINHVVNASSSMDVEGVLIINVSGDLSTDNDMNTEVGSSFLVNGTFSLVGELEVNGEMFNSGSSTIEYLHNDGYICNSGLISCSDRVRNHGGLIECGGTIITCEFDMENGNAAVAVTGSASAELFAQNVCCQNPNSPDPFDDLEDDWYIDSANVSICGLPLIPDAGDNALSTLCNDESTLDLNSLISVGSDNGTFSENTSSGAFDPSTGILTTNGLAAGTYTFTYTVVGFLNNDESTFEITINPVQNTFSAISTCENGLPFEWNGLSLNEAGNYSVTLSSTDTGCDSIVNLSFTINPVQNTFSAITTCENGLPYEWNGLSLNEAGNYSVTLSNTDTGCDSIVNLSFTVDPSLSSMTALESCSSDLPIDWNGLSLSQEGSYSVVLTGSNGCDSTAILELSVEELEFPEITTSGPVECPKDVVELYVNDIPNAEFFWNGPLNYESSEVNNSFELDIDNEGTYSVYYTLNSCVSEVAQIDLAIENVFDYKDFDFPNVITANDDGINEKIDVEDFLGFCEDFTLSIRDRWGAEVYVQERGEPSFNGNSILGEKLPEGVYFYNLRHSRGESTGFIHLLK